MIEKLVEIGNLFDFYGKLLSERQYRVVELFYLHDLSLTEIGEELDITRQGVYDNLKRAEDNLYKYENKLNLYSKFEKAIDDVREILKITEDIYVNSKNKETKNKIKEIDNIILKITKESWEVEK